MLKVVIHDYAGHPFPLTLSKELSKNYKVFHLYFKNDYGPKADLNDNFSENLKIESVGSQIKYDKNNFLSRFVKDIIYGFDVAKRIKDIKPDIIISGQSPTFSQQLIIKASKKINSKFIFWVQDFYSIAVEYILKKKISFFSIPISFLFKYFEKKQFKIADYLIIISDDFSKQLSTWQINQNKISVIENWGNLDQIKFNKKKNYEFLKENNLDIDKFTIMYTGTLALKHDPDLIIKIANSNLDLQIIIIGIGSGYQVLKNKLDLPKNIKILNLQPFDKMNMVLSSTDIFLAMLNNDAGKYSVPSKILNYLCAGKPIILSAPKDNLASKIIRESNSGSVFNPDNFDELNKFINKLKNENETRKVLSENARKYAENNFQIKEISLKFKNIINNIINKNK